MLFTPKNVQNRSEKLLKDNIFMSGFVLFFFSALKFQNSHWWHGFVEPMLKCKIITIPNTFKLCIVAFCFQSSHFLNWIKDHTKKVIKIRMDLRQCSTSIGLVGCPLWFNCLKFQALPDADYIKQYEQTNVRLFWDSKFERCYQTRYIIYHLNGRNQ